MTLTDSTTRTAPTTGARPRGSGRLNVTYWRLELARTLRNPWTMGFSVVMPALLYLFFGAAPSYGGQPLAHGNVAGLIAASMALFGAMMAATNVAGSVADERATGWNRQLRLTPLRPGAYVASKILSALVLGFIVVAVTFALAFCTGGRLDAGQAVATFAVAWLGGTVLFAAFGLAVGYLFKSEAVLGVVGPFMSLFAFAGGLFIPLEQLGSVMERVGSYTPMWGLNVIVEDLVMGEPLRAAAVLNVGVWFALFASVAAWRYGRVAGRE